MLHKILFQSNQKVVAAMAILSLCFTSFGLTVTQDATGISVSVDASGVYSIASTTPVMAFSGTLGKNLAGITTINNTDKIGDYTGITFTLTGNGPLQGTIRLYKSIPVVIFSMKTLAAMASLGVTFPDFTTYPKTNMLYLGQQSVVSSHPT